MTASHVHLVRKRILKHLAKVASLAMASLAKWLSVFLQTKSS